MNIEFTGRNFNISPAIRKHVTTHFKKIHSVLQSDARAHVILSVEKHHRHVAEIVVNWHDRSLTSKADSGDMYASALKAIDKIRKQIVKAKGKIIDRIHNAPATKTVAPSPLPPVIPDSPEPRIIRSRRYSVKPMTAEEAILQVEGGHEHFVVFKDADTDRVGVLYRRNDGNFGLIQP